MRFIVWVLAGGLLSLPASAEKPAGVGLVAPPVLGPAFRSAGVDWQRVEGVIAIPAGTTASMTDSPVTRSGSEARVGPWLIVAAGSAGPRENLPAGLVFERSLPRLGLSYYRIRGGEIDVVRRLAALPGVSGAEAVVKTGRAIAH